MFIEATPHLADSAEMEVADSRDWWYVVDRCKLIVDEDAQVANHFRGHDGTVGFNIHYFDGDLLSHDGLRSNQMSSVLDEFSFRRIDALQVWISWMQSINLDLALMMSVVESLMYSWVSSAYRWIVIPWRWAILVMLEVYKMKRRGPRMDPCGTPNRMLYVLEVWKPMRTVCERLERN